MVRLLLSMAIKSDIKKRSLHIASCSIYTVNSIMVKILRVDLVIRKLSIL